MGFLTFLTELRRLTGTVKVRVHCPALDCGHVANARSLEAATTAVEDHVARVHAGLPATTWDRDHHPLR